MKTSRYSILFCVCFAFCVFSLPVGCSLAQDEVVPFIVATDEGPRKLDPLDAYDSESIETIMQVCEGLYMYNYSSSEMETIPCLAADMGVWNPSIDTLTIILKQGVTFHDGSKFNASAVKWNFDRLQYWTYGWDIDGGDIYTAGDGDLEAHPAGTASKTLFKQGATVILNHTEIVSEYEVKFVLNLPSVIWENLLAFIACSFVLPDTDYVYGETFLNRIDLNDPLVGTGPFMLTDYNFDNQVVFDYYPDYHLQWGDNHIKRMIYLIIPDPVTSSLAVLNHKVHWGEVTSDYSDEFAADPYLIKIPRKTSTVYYISMSMINILWEYRYASSFAWNHSHFLNITMKGKHYELHVPIPDGMEYHYAGFEGEPYYNLTKARDILLSSSNPNIQSNLTLNGLNATSSREEWRTVAESSTPVAWLNYVEYRYGLMGDCGWGWGCIRLGTTEGLIYSQLQDNLKDIGIRVELECVCLEFSESLFEFLYYNFGGWGPDYNDPINMIEPLYGTNASSNIFGLNNATWNQKLIDTYSTRGEERRALFQEIQSDFCTIHVPSIYILQRGDSISFNRNYIDETSITDLLNIMSDLYWFNIRFTPPEKKIPGYELFTLIGVAFGVTVFLIIYMKKPK